MLHLVVLPLGVDINLFFLLQKTALKHVLKRGCAQSLQRSSPGFGIDACLVRKSLCGSDLYVAQVYLVVVMTALCWLHWLDLQNLVSCCCSWPNY